VRRGLLVGAAFGVVNTAVVVALDRALRRGGDFGWYSYSPMPRRYADYLPHQHVVNGWAAIGLVAGVLVVVNAVLVGTCAAVVRRRTATR
jgi:heme/copper-type cytochrome/quinol oxidase subunit 1